MDQFMINAILSIKLANGQIFQGIFKEYNKQRKCIKLIDAYEISDGIPVKTAQYFYENEIESVDEVNKNKEKNDLANKNKNIKENKLDPMQRDLNDVKTIRKRPISKPEIENIKLKVEEIQYLIDSVIYIWQCDKSFHDAVDDIKNQQFIGINIEGAGSARLLPASILSISTPEQIYLFDITLLGNALQMAYKILENNSIKKIIHDSVNIIDYLKHRNNCQLNNVYDTMVTHCLIRKKKKKPITLKKCLLKYLNVSIDYSEVNWRRRPLSEESQKRAAQNVAYLLELHFYQIYDVLLLPLRKMAIEYTKPFTENEDPTKVFHYISTNQSPGLKSIDVNALQLDEPKDLLSSGFFETFD